MGEEGEILLWISNGLRIRKQRVGISGHFPQWKQVSSAVPQGSVLRPVHFQLFINKVELVVRSADDINSYSVVKTS